MRKELPLKHIEEPKKMKPGELSKGTESEIFEFKPEKGKKYVFKEVYNVYNLPMRRETGYHGETLEEKASDMKKVYDILKKHYGDRVTDTHFIVGKNEEGEPCIMKIQEKIEGVPLYKLKDEDPRCKKAWKQMREIENGIPEVVIKLTKDPRLKDYSKEETGSLIGDIGNQVNIIVNKKGNITAVDW